MARSKTVAWEPTVTGESTGVTAENSAKKQRGKPFKKGQSGNPKGKPKGARHKITLAAEVLLDGEAEAILGLGA